MSIASQPRTADEISELRRQAGRWLRQLREARHLSQRQVADLTGSEYYTFVSQLETGRGRIAPEKYRIWAETLGVDVRSFVRQIVRFYDPVTYDILFADEDESGSVSAGEI